MKFFLLILPASFIAAILLGLVVRIIERLTFRKHTVIAEYEAPHLLTPAELGFLFDKEFGKNELLASVLTLVRLKMVDIRKHVSQNPLVIARSEIKDERLKELSDGELAVWSWLRDQPERTVEWKDLSGFFSSTFGGKASFQHEVRQGLVNKGYLKRKPSWFSFGSNYAKVALVVSVGIIFALTVYYFSAVDSTSNRDGFDTVDKYSGFLLIALMVVISWFPLLFWLRLLFLAYYMAANKPVATTAKFKKHWHDVAGFQEFIRTVEFSRMDVDPNPYDESLAYAVALGFIPDLNKMTGLASRSTI